ISPFHEASVAGCSANSTVALDQNITISPGNAPGTYYLGYKIDDQAEVAECNENNNGIFYWTVTVGSPCYYSLSSSSASYGASAAAGNFNVTADGGCSWTAAASSSWIHT